jgi:hypothetical protein
VIRRGSQRCFPALPAELSYAFLERERRALLELVSVPEFLERERATRSPAGQQRVAAAFAE